MKGLKFVPPKETTSEEELLSRPTAKPFQVGRSATMRNQIPRNIMKLRYRIERRRRIAALKQFGRDAIRQVQA